MMWSVAMRFPGEGPVGEMKISELAFWYEGHRRMVEDEDARLGVKSGE